MLGGEGRGVLGDPLDGGDGQHAQQLEQARGVVLEQLHDDPVEGAHRQLFDELRGLEERRVEPGRGALAGLRDAARGGGHRCGDEHAERGDRRGVRLVLGELVGQVAQRLRDRREQGRVDAEGAERVGRVDAELGADELAHRVLGSQPPAQPLERDGDVGRGVLYGAEAVHLGLLRS